MRLISAALCLVTVSSHGMMLDPISRNAKEGINTLGGSMWVSNQQPKALFIRSSLAPRSI